MLNLHLQNQFVVTYFAYLFFKEEKMLSFSRLCPCCFCPPKIVFIKVISTVDKEDKDLVT